MAHFAQLDENNVVTQVIVVSDNDCLLDGVENETVGILFCKQLFGPNTKWKQTSYNAKIRKNYAGIGYTYRADIDAFVSPQPFASWILNNETAEWGPPISIPADAGTGEPPKRYSWNEETTSWVEVQTETTE